MAESVKSAEPEKESPSKTESEKPSPKLWVVAGVFLVSVLIFTLLLRNSLASVSLTLEGLTNYLSVLACFFLAVSLAIVFSLVSEKRIGLLVSLAAALIFGLLLTTLALPWRLVVGAVFFVGLFYLRGRARKTHEAYTGFGASHYRGIMTSFFLILALILSAMVFVWSQDFFTRKLSTLQREQIESFVGQSVLTLGEVIARMAPAPVPENEIAPAVEQLLGQILQPFGFVPQADAPATSYAQITERVSTALEEAITGATAPYLIYVPFIIGGLLLITLGSLAPFVAIVGVPVFFIAYRLLLLARVLKLEEVERPVKRLALA